MLLNIKFSGEIADLEYGIKQIANMLDSTFNEGDISVLVERVHNGFSVFGENGLYKISYDLKSDFFRALTFLCAKLRKGILHLRFQWKCF